MRSVGGRPMFPSRPTPWASAAAGTKHDSKESWNEKEKLPSPAKQAAPRGGDGGGENRGNRQKTAYGHKTTHNMASAAAATRCVHLCAVAPRRGLGRWPKASHAGFMKTTRGDMSVAAKCRPRFRNSSLAKHFAVCAKFAKCSIPGNTSHKHAVVL